MIVFANAKINIGLSVVRRRADGYHDVSTIMAPVPGLCDILEITPRATDSVHSYQGSGIAVDCAEADNLVMRAIRAVEKEIGQPLPPLDLHLHKMVPYGAGLGAGSADGAFTLKAVNDMMGLGLDNDRLRKLAASLGADCPFFIDNRTALATGTGTTLRPIELPLTACGIAIVKPAEGVSTRGAYAGITPGQPAFDLAQLPSLPPEAWRGRAVNDFETVIFSRLPLLADIKRRLYEDTGALYASMTGSGSAVYGLYEGSAPDKEQLQKAFPGAFVYTGTL